MIGFSPVNSLSTFASASFKDKTALLCCPWEAKTFAFFLFIIISKSSRWGPALVNHALQSSSMLSLRTFLNLSKSSSSLSSFLAPKVEIYLISRSSVFSDIPQWYSFAFSFILDRENLLFSSPLFYPYVFFSFSIMTPCREHSTFSATNLY